MVAAELKRRGRPRSEEAERAILKATLVLLEQRPLRDLTVEQIAEEAQVGKATIYKWWPGKVYVALEAFLSIMQQSIVTESTGSALEDFRRQLISLIEFYASPMGTIFRQLLAECQADQEFAASYRTLFLEPRRAAVRDIWQRGVSRREIESRWDCELVLDMIYAPLVYRVLANHAPFDHEDANRLVEAVFHRLRPR
jgi:AcrR family transcriptional regulator